jgi:GNAT superfamily N-acetyltransferase
VIGFVNVAWDGGDHGFLLDTKTHSVYQHKGVGARLVEVAARHAKAAGCDWLHDDFEPDLEPFYVEACRPGSFTSRHSDRAEALADMGQPEPV